MDLLNKKVFSLLDIYQNCQYIYIPKRGYVEHMVVNIILNKIHKAWQPAMNAL